MAGFTKKDETNKEFAQGGDTHMFGQQHAGPQKSAVTETKSGSDGKFAAGGKGKMFGFAGSEPAKAGITSAR